jgi:hypothetical protein
MFAVHVKRPRTWFWLGGLTAVLGVFVVPGTVGAILLAAALVLLFIGTIRALRATPPDDRAAGVQIFGGGG